MRGSGGISGGGRPSPPIWKASRRLPLRGRPRDSRAGGRERLQRLDRYLVALVVTHFAVTLAHAGSHFALQILSTGLDLVFILSVITIGPIVGLSSSSVSTGSSRGASSRFSLRHPSSTASTATFSPPVPTT